MGGSVSLFWGEQAWFSRGAPPSEGLKSLLLAAAPGASPRPQGAQGAGTSVPEGHEVVSSPCIEFVQNDT